MRNSSIVVVPFYKENLNPNEIYSYRHLEHYFSLQEVTLVAPDNLSINITGYPIIRFPDHFFYSTSNYSQLLLSSEFYRTFNDFTHILIYQLDCLVFSSDLEAWCAAGYDYLGAPWFRDTSDPSRGFSRVGNGGLSLRNVRSQLQVLESRRIPSWKEALYTRLPDLSGINLLQRLYKQFKVIRAARRGVDWYTSHYSLNEDHFWSDRAHLFSPDFKIAPVSVALQFSFERYPRYCYEQNDHQLPFGCHAWTKWDREFWEHYLIS